AEAAKEIKLLIQQSVDQVGDGARLVDDTGQTIQAIVEQVHQVSSLINEINSASQEQARGIAQVSDAVSQLDQVTQQNAALVEESAAAAASLNQQAETLTQMVSVFTLNDYAVRESLEGVQPPSLAPAALSGTKRESVALPQATTARIAAEV
ncbi:MAG: methyl-accepting chemotaxis protein, partial [Acidovorax sp.]|nr:methyl-accepting chemotaxis protein [Acidovorax sp.]